FNAIPSMRELANVSTAQLRAGARIIASELEATGLNLDFAPVLDLDHSSSLMSERVLAPTAGEVARLAAAFVEELSKKNILSCAKELAGMGGADRDPHFGLARVDRSKRLLQQEDILPFLNLIDDVGMIMVSHVCYPGMGDEKGTPASLSPRIIESYLRK